MATASLPNPHHRKIELQSPLDLTHLQTQLTTSARQKLDLHFPPSALRSKPATHIALGGLETASAQDTAAQQQQQQPPPQETPEDEESDPLRQHVQSLLTAFLHRTWCAAAQSITINGLDAHTLPQFANNSTGPTTTSASTATTLPEQRSTTGTTTEPTQEMEGVHYTLSPYDSRLQTRLATLYGELESLTAQVSRLRREAPARGAEMLRGGLAGEIGNEDAMFEDAVKKDEAEEGQEEQLDWRKEGQQQDARREGWYEDVRGSYEAAVLDLARLSGRQPSQIDVSTANAPAGSGGGGLTGCVGKVQRARDVAEELE